MRQPAGTEQARRVALDGQGGQRREPEQLAGLHEQGGPAAVGHRKSEVYPAGRGQPRAGQQPGLLAGQGEHHGVGGQSQDGAGQQRHAGARPLVLPGSAGAPSHRCDLAHQAASSPRLRDPGHEPYAGLHK